ncbi:MAG: hypothetical protein GF344_11430 [Chitinivibrionales bacterium]|nr:hypothetical protein [Chitinivibrionales bacterium]MBD3357412.1 hypothetical protein [Chitinivibrionales bacterium]
MQQTLFSEPCEPDWIVVCNEGSIEELENSIENMFEKALTSKGGNRAM